MKTVLAAGMAMAFLSGSALAVKPVPDTWDAQLTQPAPMYLVQRPSTPDTSTPGSTGPANRINTRPAYVSRKDQHFAEELRRCEIISASEERRACKDSARSRFGDM